MDNEGDEIGVDDELDLFPAACCYVTQEPDCFLVDLLLVVTQQAGKVSQGAAVEYLLCLLVCARYDVTHSPQRCRLCETRQREALNQGA